MKKLNPFLIFVLQVAKQFRIEQIQSLLSALMQEAVNA
jgi:hypothetical protein